MKTAAKELKKEIVDMRQKRVEIEMKLDVIIISQFRILSEVAEVKQAPIRDEDALFIPNEEDLVEINDSEKPESVMEPTTSRRSVQGPQGEERPERESIWIADEFRNRTAAKRKLFQSPSGDSYWTERHVSLWKSPMARR
ncbi:hypothetical protein Y032_0052g2238 [Ancylostoma ceylanicum]|uniref:Uncharacterized protein n=1 Tax=Ancylostoma ceylanicum TaxID=53326 RepID=A0A016U886_9BILA|nr:hypothetical protein Y032_0052g2238 [Ancylostoma ceylanicum]